MKKVKIFARIAALVAAAAMLAACGTLPQELQQPENRTEDIAFLEVQPQKVPLAEIPQAPAVPPATEAPQPAPTQPTPAQPAPVMTLEQAKDTVLAHLNLTEEQLSRVEFDFDDGVYELDFYVGNVEYDVKLDASGNILNIRKEEEKVPQPVPAEPAPTQPTPAQPAPVMTLEQAKDTVLAHLNLTEEQLSRVEFDFDDGVYELDFHVGNVEYDVKLDASGNILNIRKEEEKVPQPVPAEPAPTQPTPAQPAPVMTLEQAKDTVLAHLNLTEEQLSRVEFDFDDGVYELDFHVGNVEYDVKLDASGNILNIRKEEENKPQPTPAAITLEQAKQIVFAKLNITESQIADKEFDFDDGVYELEFRIGSMEYDFAVDAGTGAIVKSHREYDD